MMSSDLPFKIHITTVRDNIVFQINYINLHRFEENGCIVAEKDSLILDNIYYKTVY